MSKDELSMKVIKNYIAKVKTGQDMINEGIKPKTSSEMMALIVQERLKELKNIFDASLTKESFGHWVPLFQPVLYKSGERIKVDAQIFDMLKSGSPVSFYHFNSAKQVDGKVVGINKPRKTIKVVGEFPPGSKNIVEEENTYHNIQSLEAIITKGVIIAKDYKIPASVTKNKETGHRIRFNQKISSNNYKITDDHYNNLRVTIPKGTTGIIQKEERESITIKLDKHLPDQGKRKNFVIDKRGLTDIMEVSSLGQIKPRDKEKTVYEEALKTFFPLTVLEPERAELILTSLLMKKDLVLYGPPGAGKSRSMKDIILELPQKHQKIMFVEENCNANCNPYSIFDPEFAKTVPPCPDCKIKYDPQFKKTGFFTQPSPKEVKVSVRRVDVGSGVEIKESTVKLNRTDLVGYKLPEFGGAVNDMSDPKGFQHGVLIRTNNGYFAFEEIDKLRPDTLDNVLESLNADAVQPNELRYQYPSHNLMIATTNDQTKTSDAFNDRAIFLAIRYSEDPDVGYDVTRVAFHGEKLIKDDVEVSNVHTTEYKTLMDVPIPVPMEKAVESFWIKFRAEYAGNGGNKEIYGSNRSKIDAHLAARAHWRFDEMFFEQTPCFPDAQYMMKGISFALCSRVQELEKKADQEAKAELQKFTAKHFPALLKGEEDKFWCDVQKRVALFADNFGDALLHSYDDEISMYMNNPKEAINTFTSLRDYYTGKSKDPAAIAEFPLMDALFEFQPNFTAVDKNVVPGLVKYFLSKKNDI